MNAAYGKVRQVGEVTQLRRILVLLDEYVARQREYETVQAGVVVGERVVVVEAVDLDVAHVDLVVAEDAARIYRARGSKRHTRLLVTLIHGDEAIVFDARRRYVELRRGHCGKCRGGGQPRVGVRRSPTPT